MKKLTDFINATELAEKVVNPSKVHLAQVTVLREKDVLCTQCAAQTEMLCEGSRLYFDGDDLRLESCWKLTELQNKQEWRTRMRGANLGDSKVAHILANPTEKSKALVSKEDGGFIINGNKFPQLSYGEYSRAFTDAVKEYAVAFVDNGFRPKYVLTVQLYKHERLSSTNVYLNDDRLMDAMSKEIYDPEWLILDGLDIQGNAKIRQAMLKCLRWRIDEMRPTTVSLSKTVTAQTDEEDDLYGEISTWKKLNLQ